MAPPQVWKNPRSCDLCGSPFTPMVPWQRFCSVGCKKKNAQQLGPSRIGVEQRKHCAQCDATFNPSNPRQTLCSNACRRARRSRVKSEWQSGLPHGYRNSEMQKAQKRQYDRSRDRARNHGKTWTGPELELVARGDLTREELMSALGRTSYAINSVRRLLRDDPRKQALAGAANSHNSTN